MDKEREHLVDRLRGIRSVCVAYSQRAIKENRTGREAAVAVRDICTAAIRDLFLKAPGDVDAAHEIVADWECGDREPEQEVLEQRAA